MNLWAMLRTSLRKVYQDLGKSDYFEQDVVDLEKAYFKIEDYWMKQYERIKGIKFILLSEAPQFGKDEIYIYNPLAPFTRFFYASDLAFVLNTEIEGKLSFFDHLRTLKFMVVDIFPFAFNKETAIHYAMLANKGKYEGLFKSTYPDYLSHKLDLLMKNRDREVKFLYRYARVKDNSATFLKPKLIEKGFQLPKSSLNSIGKRGGMINKTKLKSEITQD